MKIPGAYTLLKFIIPAILIYSLITINELAEERERGENLLRELQVKAGSIERENDRIASEINSAEDDEFIAAIARERFGLVMPDEIVFYGPSH